MKGCTRMQVTKFQERHPELPCVTPDDFIVDTKAQKFVTTKGDAHADKADTDCSHIWSSMAVCGSQSSCQYIVSLVILVPWYGQPTGGALTCWQRVVAHCSSPGRLPWVSA